MAKREKTKKVRKNNLVDQAVYDAYKDAIPADEIWDYQVEGLQKPHINKPFENMRAKKIMVVIILVIAISVSIFFSFWILHNDAFKYTTLADGSTEFTRFSNPGELRELRIDYVITDVQSDLQITKDEAGKEIRTTTYTLTRDENRPITAIHEYAFNCDEKIRVIEIGRDVTTIDEKAFYSCYALREIRVDEENPNYCDIDGVLFDKDCTELICYPIDHDAYLRERFGYVDEKTGETTQFWPTENWKNEGKDKYNEYYTRQYENEVNTYVVPSTVKKIGPLAFNYSELFRLYLPEGLERLETMAIFRNWHIERVDTYVGDYDGNEPKTEKFIPDRANVKYSLPDSLTYIGSDCFNSAIEMDYIYIPENVTEIGHHAFWAAARKENGKLIGLYEIHAAREQADFKANVTTGDEWTGEYDNGVFPKNVPVLYGETRLPLPEEPAPAEAKQ